MLQEVTLRQSFPNPLVRLGRIRLQRQSERLKDHLLQDLKPELLVLTGLLSEVDSLRKDDSSSLILNLELCVGPSHGEIILIVKASSPDHRLRSQDPVSHLSADQVEVSQVLVCGEEAGHVLEDLGDNVLVVEVHQVHVTASSSLPRSEGRAVTSHLLLAASCCDPW